MAALYKIFILCVGFALSCNLWAQSRDLVCGDLNGIWQEKTPVVNSAFLATYTISADSFWYSVNEYDDSINLRIQYIKRISYPDICRDQFSSANNQWSILEKGTLITDTLPTPQCFVLPIKMASNTLFIDAIPLYLIFDEQY